MAFDLLFQRETDSDWAIDRPAPLGLEFSPTERKTLKLLEPSTVAHAVDVVSWARGHGIPARLSHTAIYTPEDVEMFYKKGASIIQPGKLSWHSVGRAYHLVITLPNGELDKDAYRRVGQYARSQGGDWLGDRPFKNFEYHPGTDIATYRKSELAAREFKQAQRRARIYT
jgi:hypothetical protein